MPCGEYFTGYESRMGLIRWRVQRVALVAGLPVPFVLPFVVGGETVETVPPPTTNGRTNGTGSPATRATRWTRQRISPIRDS